MQEFDARTPTPAHETAIDCPRTGIEATLPDRVVRESVSLDGDTLTVVDETYGLSAYDRILAVGRNKAGDGVAGALGAVLGDRIDDGVAVTPDPTSSPGGHIERLPGDHPVPSTRGVKSTRRLVDPLSDLDDRTLILMTITGDASVVLPAPAEGVSFAELQETTDRLLENGAEIRDFSAVRKHVSTLKGGGLARLAAPATVVGLVLSDVVGSDLGVIASGPTAPDETTYGDVLDVLDRFDLDMPKPVRAHSARSSTGGVPKTPRPGDPVFDRVTNHVLANTFTALDAAREVTDDRGYESLILSSRVRGEAREAAKTHVAITEESLATGNPITIPAVVLSGGEYTVTARGNSDSRPGLEFCLAAAAEPPDRTILANTNNDGKDGGIGITSTAVNASLVTAGDAHAALTRSNALPMFQGTGTLVEPDTTGTNVNDLRALVASKGV